MNDTRTLKAAASGPAVAVESSSVRGAAPRREEATEFKWSPKDFETVPHSKMHRIRCREVEDALEDWLAGRDAYVGGDQNVYYDRHDLNRVVAPDVFVVLGVSGEPRINYRIWVEGPPPAFVLEVLSPSTRKRDLGEKKRIYESMGVREYFVFEGDEDEERRRPVRPLEPPLQGFRLGGACGTARYEPIGQWPSRERPHGDVTIGYTSEVLGLGVTLRRDREGVRLFDPGRGDFLPTAEEARSLEKARAAEERARAEGERTRAAEDRAARAAAEARVAELERLLAARN